MIAMMKAMYNSEFVQGMLFGPQLPKPPAPQIPKKYGKEPYPFQLRSVKDIERYKGVAYLALDTGLGKSPTSLIWHLWHPEARPAIIVCQATIKYNWERECSAMGLRAEILTGHRKKGVFTDAPILIVNYDILASWEDYLISIKPKIITLDEAHLLGNRNTLRTKTVKAICEHAKIPYRLALSGTPIPNNISELWSVLNILRPDLYPDFEKFVWRFSEPRRTRWGWDFGETVRMGILNANLKHTVMIRRRKEEVLKDLPKQTRSIVLLDLENRKEYEHAVNDFEGWLKSSDPSKVLDADNKLGHLLRLVTRLKLKNVIKWLEDFIAGNKLIFFGIHNSIFLDKLKEHFGERCVLVNGSVTDKHRQNAIDKFNNDPSCKLFLGQIRAVAEGWNCTCTSYTAFGEFYWNPIKHVQGEGRVRGLFRGLKGVAANSFWLTAVNTVEEKLFKMIQRKQDMSDMAIDGQKGISGLNIYHDLLGEMRKELKKK